LNGYQGGGGIRSGNYQFALYEVYDAAIGSTAASDLYDSQINRFPPAPPPPPYVGKAGGRQFAQGFNSA
jgi:hypothetical protein